MPAPALPPGPRHPRPAQAVLWGLRYPEFTQAAHRRHGPTFTIRPGTTPPLVLTSDRDAIRRLFTGDPLARHHGNDTVRPLIGERSVLLLNPDEHLTRRRLLLPPFHGERIRAYAELAERLMTEAIACWRPGDAVAVLPVAQNVTIEVILQALLGIADEPLRRRFRRLIDDLLFYPLGTARLRAGTWLASRVAPPHRLRELAALASGFPTPAVLTSYPELKPRSSSNVLTRRWWRHRDDLYALFDELIAATQRDPELATRTDVLAMLLQARDDSGGGLADDDLRDDLLTLIGAGHETTAAAIAWGVALLAHDTAVRERAAAAARTGDDAYLAALVKEILRLRPPLPVAACRVLPEPFPIGPHLIPAGTSIMVDAWGVHHDPSVHPDPAAFRPERFLDTPPEPYAWLPFGGGAHRCLGAALAELEIKVALSTILRTVEITPLDAELTPAARRAVTLVPHGGARIRVAGRVDTRVPPAAVG